MSVRGARTLPFFGSGVGFPFRVNPSTGGLLVTTGNTDSISVALEYLQESWSIREETDPQVNHNAESIAHILLTIPGEHDTLPEFGSNLFLILFEPNTYEFRQQAEAYFKFSTIRWEKRARVPEYIENYSSYSGVRWKIDGRLVDLGVCPVLVMIDFIPNQVPGNLVIPFVTDGAARASEYPVGSLSPAGHDYVSRYKDEQLSYRSGIRYSRVQKRLLVPYGTEDQYYVAKKGDTWLLLSWKFYGDIRYWYILARLYVSDNSDMDRSIISPLVDPPVGAILRIPPKPAILMELANA